MNVSEEYPNLMTYPDLMTPGEVAKVLRSKPSMVRRLIGLKKTRIGNRRGRALYRRQDVIDYINSKVEKEEVIENACEQKGRYREVGVSSLPSWKEFQKTLMEHQRRGA